jgi:hypothetical protein
VPCSRALGVHSDALCYGFYFILFYFILCKY